MKERRTLAEYVALPIWGFIWVTTFGRMGKPFWESVDRQTERLHQAHFDDLTKDMIHSRPGAVIRIQPGVRYEQTIAKAQSRVPE